VYIYFVQACLAGERPGRWNWLQPRPNGSSLAYAWDEPNEEHLLRVKVFVTILSCRLSCLLRMTVLKLSHASACRKSKNFKKYEQGILALPSAQ
jgi:hypothetical protein